jgi:KUP system potassium uptake protein
MREIWHWSLPAAASVAGVFLVVDAGFVAANMLKVLEGGYVPLVLAALVYGIMYVWHRGSAAVSARVQEAVIPIYYVSPRGLTPCRREAWV